MNYGLNELEGRYSNARTLAKELWLVLDGSTGNTSLLKQIAAYIRKHGENVWNRDSDAGKISPVKARLGNVYRIKKIVNNTCTEWFIDFNDIEKSMNEMDEAKRTRTYYNLLYEIKEKEISINSANLLVTGIKEYLLENIQTPSQSLSDLTQKKWFAYFLHYKGSNDHIEPELGKAYLEIISSKRATFKNIIGDTDYDGKYTPHNNLGHGIIIFDLSSRSEQGRHLHIKVHYEGQNQNIAVGHYTVYEHNRIESGNIVLQEIKGTDDISRIGSYSFTNRPEELEDELIHPAIKRFLSVKSESYHQLVHGVKTVEELNAKLLSYKLKDYTHSLFLEKKMPEIFIASPISASTKEFDINKFTKLKLFIESSFENKVVVNFNTKEDGFDEDNHPQPFNSLEKLKTVRIFILITDEVSSLSFAFMQLGFALMNCKFVIIASPKKLLSKTLQKIVDIRQLHAVSFEGKLTSDEEWDNLNIKLVEKIKDFLPQSYGGNQAY